MFSTLLITLYLIIVVQGYGIVFAISDQIEHDMKSVEVYRVSEKLTKFCIHSMPLTSLSAKSWRGISLECLKNGTYEYINQLLESWNDKTFQMRQIHLS